MLQTVQGYETVATPFEVRNFLRFKDMVQAVLGTPVTVPKNMA